MNVSVTITFLKRKKTLNTVPARSSQKNIQYRNTEDAGVLLSICILTHRVISKLYNAVKRHGKTVFTHTHDTRANGFSYLSAYSNSASDQSNAYVIKL
jgi:hypothetical protein